MKPHFFAAETTQAQEARKRLTTSYGDTPLEQADCVVALGGDGSMLRALHDSIRNKKPVFGMNRGSVGFLLNEYREKGLMERLERAQTVKLTPLCMRVTTMTGRVRDALAINEVSLLRETRQAAKLKISIDNDIAQARASFTAAIATLDNQRKNMTLAENVYDQTKKKFEVGTGSNTEITSVQTDLQQAQTNFVQALYDAIVAKVDYFKATGKLQ